LYLDPPLRAAILQAPPSGLQTFANRTSKSASSRLPWKQNHDNCGPHPMRMRAVRHQHHELPPLILTTENGTFEGNEVVDAEILHVNHCTFEAEKTVVQIANSIQLYMKTSNQTMTQKFPISPHFIHCICAATQRSMNNPFRTAILISKFFFHIDQRNYFVIIIYLRYDLIVFQTVQNETCQKF